MTVRALDSRSWLAWGLAAMTPVLVSRNPWVLAEVLLAVLVVRVVWLPHASGPEMGWYLRIASLFLLIGVVFNVLTVHVGDRVIASLPDAWPIVGGDLTWNALLYGVLSALALFTLLLVGITVSTHISWIDLVHALPPRLAPIAVSGSVAWAFLPQTAIAWRQIREAQTMRGHIFRRARDFVPIVVPLLAGGLERSLVLAEALESRGFGVAAVGLPPHQRPTRPLAANFSMIAGLVAIAVFAYSAATGNHAWAFVSLGVGVLSLAGAGRFAASPKIGRTRYRVVHWSAADSLVVVTSLVVALIVVAWNFAHLESLVYRIYPELALPPVDLVLMALLGLLIVPAFVPGGEDRS